MRKEGRAHHPAIMSTAPTLTVDVFFDLVCPWCLIGKRHLESALTQLQAERPDLAIAVEWRSHPLLPHIPFEGVPYRDFYLARLGSAEAVAARQAQVQAAAQTAGLTLALTRIDVFPNTLLAHRLVRYARQEAGAGAATVLVENLFPRFFHAGEDIGDARVLREAMLASGIALPADAGLSHESPWLPPVFDARNLPDRSGSGVPHFIFNNSHDVSGAVSPAVLLQAMRYALAEM